MNQPTPALTQRRRNSALWAGSAFMLLTLLSYLPYFLKMQIQSSVTWLNVLLPAAGLAFSLVGLKRAFFQRQEYGGRISGSVLGAIALLLFSFSAFASYKARDLPGSAGAPRVGQKAPEFTLTDSHGQSVSLSQLLAGPPSSLSGKAPKAVLLVFYRGYW
jgi:hypothetical protein